MQQADVYPMTRNLDINPRLIGMENLLAPGATNISSQRLNMFSSNLTQYLVLFGCEAPLISTGFERLFQNYSYDQTERGQNMMILAVIKKYPPTGAVSIKRNPRTTVIYLGDDRKVHYFNLDTYTRCSEGFGYMNEIGSKELLQPGQWVPKEVKFSWAPTVKGNRYCYGVNANVAYMSIQETTEDAFVISRSKAKQMGSKAIHTLTISIDPNMVPVNSYGTDDEPKFMPDIGETVRENGILCALRKANDYTLISDMARSELLREQNLHDDLYYAPYGAEILDIDVDINPSAMRKIKTPPELFRQLEKYQEHMQSYWDQIWTAYKEAKKNGYDLSPAFNSLAMRAKLMLDATARKSGQNRKNPPKLTKKGEPISFIQLTITYAHDYEVNKGYKITGRDGAAQ